MILMGGIQHANDPGTGQFFVGLVNDDPTAGRDWRDTHIGRRAAYGLKEIKAASDPAIGRTMTRLFAQTNDRHIASCLGIALSDVTGLRFDSRSYIRGSHSSIEPMPDDQADRRGLAERWMARLAD